MVARSVEAEHEAFIRRHLERLPFPQLTLNPSTRHPALYAASAPAPTGSLDYSPVP